MQRQRDFFSQLPAGARQRLLGASQKRSVGPGHVIFREGTPADGLFSIAAGRIEISRTNADGRRRILNIVRAPDMLGEIGLIDGGPRTATAIAMTKTEFYCVSRECAHRLMRQDPRLAHLMAVALGKRLRWVDEQLADHTNRNVPARMAKWLLHLDALTRHGGGENLELAQDDLADMVGSSREHVNRTLVGWRNDGIIALSRRTVRILDREALAAWV